jgi:hypothetical protein
MPGHVGGILMGRGALAAADYDVLGQAMLQLPWGSEAAWVEQWTGCVS